MLLIFVRAPLKKAMENLWNSQNKLSHLEGILSNRGTIIPWAFDLKMSQHMVRLLSQIGHDTYPRSTSDQASALGPQRAVFSPEKKKLEIGRENS